MRSIPDFLIGLGRFHLVKLSSSRELIGGLRYHLPLWIKFRRNVLLQSAAEWELLTALVTMNIGLNTFRGCTRAL